MQFSQLLGTGSYLPKKILTNQDLEKMVDTSDEWIRERTGIKQRHIAAKNETASSMGAIAARHALEMAKVQPQDIDLIIVATSTQDKIFPSTACFVQQKLGIQGCAAFDISAACAGFNYALSIADQYIRAGNARGALVIGSEVMSRITDWSDRSTCILFADGAGAVVLGKSHKPGIISTHIHADGSYADLLYTPNPVSGSEDSEKPYMKMKGSEVFKIAVSKLGSTILETLKANNIEKADLDWLVPHQANVRIISTVAKKLDLPMNKVILTIENHGNTSAASVPLALDEGIRDGRIKPGDLILLESFGGGLAWGSALIRY